MKKILSFIYLLISTTVIAQAPVQWNSSEILLGLKKLNVLGSVLYVAAHPDDENTRLLAYFSKGKLYRTGYLSLTRGDGGQNLIGTEQGIELGLIRTQELLAARRIDGAAQFFTRAYDFGFSKSTEEAVELWGKEKVLSDVVWIIRKFQPDVILTRFPGDSRAGHGHHSASAVLAREAFIAAADPTKFPEQLTQGVKVWQARRVMWNTFNFGNVNATAENQFKMDVGAYQPLLGRSFGEIAAESRSQHKSQGFGVPSSRGESFEYFVPLAGESPVNDLFDGVNTTWNKLNGGESISKQIDAIIAAYEYESPEKSVPALIQLYKVISSIEPSYWKTIKMSEVEVLIRMAGGIYFEVSSAQEYIVQGDSVAFTIFINNRLAEAVRLKTVHLAQFDTTINSMLSKNRNLVISKKLAVPVSKPVSQPYWLIDEMEKGSFTIRDQQLIGLPENPSAYFAELTIEIDGQILKYTVPVKYKHTDPVKGELFQPLVVTSPLTINTDPGVMVFRKDKPATRSFDITATAYKSIAAKNAVWYYQVGKANERRNDSVLQFERNTTKNISLPVSNSFMNGMEKDRLLARVVYPEKDMEQAGYLALAQIDYDHIPSIRYFYPDGLTVLNISLKTAGTKIGYIRGAGDKIPEALEEMGFSVSFLSEQDMKPEILNRYDAIVTGVRAYNIHSWLTTHHEDLTLYVKNGGNLVVQYNTNSFAGPFRAKISPFPFNISRNRITDENSEINFTAPDDELLNRPNKITSADFNGWVQERGVYFADQLSKEYKTVIAMKDPGEKEEPGSLISAKYGKGRFIYTGLAFFRQLPAGVPGAYRLFANLVSNPNTPVNGTK